MANLAQALAWASHGLRIFPLPYGDKRPRLSFPELATNDPEEIRLLWDDGQEYNIGVLCGDGLAIADIDTKFDRTFSRSAVANYMAVGGHFDTLTVKTASGGYQCYFKVPGEFTNRTNIVPGVDIRCHNGYGIAPGSFSIKSGGEYELYADHEIADMPPALLALMRPIAPKKDRLNGHADPVKAIPLFVDWLQRVAPAIEGQGGDNHTYDVACMGVVDYGLSIPTVANLMAEHFNPRCQPPWELDELIVKAENAEAYGKGPLGARDPEHILNGVEYKPPASPAKIDTIRAAIEHRINAADTLLPQGEIPLTRWLMSSMLTQGSVTMVAGPGGVGKSAFLIALACHAAVGKPFGPYTFSKPFKSMLYSPEDDRSFISGRASVICQAYGIDYEEVAQSFKVFDRRNQPIVLAAMENKKVVVPDDTIRFLSDFVEKNPDNCLIMCDPMRKVLRGLSENDNSIMNDAMVCIDAMADALDQAVLATHHTPKGYMQRKDLDISSPDAASGAGAIVTSARIVVNILPQSPADIVRQGKRDDLFTVGTVKNNHGPLGKATWWERRILAAPNGERYPCPVPTDVRNAMDKIYRDYVATIGDYMLSHNINALGVSQASAVVHDVYPEHRSIRTLGETLRVIFKRGDVSQPYVDLQGTRYAMTLDMQNRTNVFTLLPMPGDMIPPIPFPTVQSTLDDEDD